MNWYVIVQLNLLITHVLCARMCVCVGEGRWVGVW